MKLFTGSFSVPVATGVGTLGPGAKYDLTQLAGFSASVAITQFSIPDATISGQATIDSQIKGVKTNATLSFDITASSGGIHYSGKLDDFQLAIAGVTLGVTGATLSDSGIAADQVQLKLPDKFGAATVTVQKLQISTDSITLAGGHRVVQPAGSEDRRWLKAQIHRQRRNSYSIVPAPTCCRSAARWPLTCRPTRRPPTCP